MAATALISIGTKAMNASYAALQTTGNNIANANVDGYSRQTVALQTAFGQFSGAGYFGKGVDVSTITRAHSDFLTREAASSRAVASADAARSQQLQQLEAVFPTGDDGIGYAAATAFNAFVDVADKPQDASARNVALARIGDLAARFRSASGQLDTLQNGVTVDLKTAVASANELTKQIAQLNRDIAAVRGNGHTPNTLLDARDKAINDLSQYVQVSTIQADDDTISVFMNGGQRLVLGGEATSLAAVTDPYDPTKVQLGISESGSTRAFPPGFVTGGSIAGLLQFQNNDLTDARNLLGQMAVAISGRLNAQQALGLDLGQPAGAGVPLLSVGSPGVSAATTNAQSGGVPVASYINASGARVPSVGLTIVDTDALKASDYELYADPALPAGSYQLTRKSDGFSQTVTNGDVVDGFRVDVTTPAPVARDRFLLQPVGPAISYIQRVLDDPKGIAAASPVTGTIGSANKGTAAIAGLKAVDPSINPNLTASITFTDDVGGFSYSLVDSTGALPTTTGTGTWTAGQPIQLNGWSLDLSGVPKSGDTLSVQKTAFPAGNNGNANAMLALRDVPFVGQQVVAGGSTTPGETVTDAYAAALAKVGVRVQSAKLSADQSASIAADAKTAQTSKVGVNLDEEAARLIQYQQSYQAAAKMLQVAASMFDTLLQVGA